MAASTRSVPSFLLPLRMPPWTSLRVQLAPSHRHGIAVVRFASKARAPSAKGRGGEKPVVLEHPARFNPPSHGSRLPSKALPKHYAPLSREEVHVQEKRDYPGLMAPKGSWAHWFWTNRSIHVWISVTTLVILGVTTITMDFIYKSPFRHMLPPASQFWSSPVAFVQRYIDVLQLHERDRAVKVIESREMRTNDAAKRRRYQAVHGLDKENPIRNLLKADYEEEPEVRPDGVDYVARDARLAAESAARAAADAAEQASRNQPLPEPEAKPKKRFGIF